MSGFWDKRPGQRAWTGGGPSAGHFWALPLPVGIAPPTDLQQPVAPPVECGHDGGMDVAAVEALKQREAGYRGRGAASESRGPV